MTTSTPSSAVPNADLDKLFDPALAPETLVDFDVAQFREGFYKPPQPLVIDLPPNATPEQLATIFDHPVPALQSTVLFSNTAPPLDLPKKDQPLNKGVAYVPNAQVWDDSTRSWQ